MTRLTNVTLRRSCLALLLLGTLLAAQGVVAQTACCRLPDLGSGTIDMAPLCPDGYAWAFTLQGSLPVGTTIEFAGALFVISSNEIPGGALGGTQSAFDGTVTVTIWGTGTLLGFNRFISIPVSGIMDMAPRTPGDAVQDFACDLFSLQGALFGDPDFCILQIEAGANFGRPSPGNTTLTRVGGPGTDFLVDSFFDIDYRIDWQGCPGSVLDGFGGVTEDQTYIYTCEFPVGAETGTWGEIKSMYAD
ncbi:hypothetical protein H8E07_09620 [bacterium]|nr:hypothetical protein [bacterium]